MTPLGPRPLEPAAGLEWTRQALALMLARPGAFLLAALTAPAGSALLLSLPVWDLLLPGRPPWAGVLATALCYAPPLAVAVTLGCAVARAAGRERPPPLGQLLTPAALRVQARATLFLVAVLLQGLIAAWLLEDLISPAALMNSLQAADGQGGGSYHYTLADTVLGSQLVLCGGLLLLLYLLFAAFIVPLQLFQEVPLAPGWRLSFKAMQLNPWLGPSAGLPGIVLILLGSTETLSVLAQVVALPLPVLLGTLMYLAWRDIFQAGDSKETMEAEEAVPG